MLNENLEIRQMIYVKTFLSFILEYQSWYSEAKILVKQLLPDRLLDFCSVLRKTQKSYKDIIRELSNRRLSSKSDCYSPISFELIVGPDAAIPRFRQQVSILKSVKTRFESSLFDIRQLVRARAYFTRS